MSSLFDHFELSEESELALTLDELENDTLEDSVNELKYAEVVSDEQDSPVALILNDDEP